MISRLKKWLGYHVCEKFSKWEYRVIHWQRVPTALEFAEGFKHVTYSREFQQRHCLDCGKIQRKEF